MDENKHRDVQRSGQKQISISYDELCTSRPPTFSKKDSLDSICYNRVNNSVNRHIDYDIEHVATSERLLECTMQSSPRHILADVLQVDLAQNNGSCAVSHQYNAKEVVNNKVEGRPSMCRLDLLRPLEFNTNVLPENTTSSDIFTFANSTPIDGHQENDIKNNISWSEMLDAELLAPAVNKEMVDMQDTNGNKKEFNIIFPNAVNKIYNGNSKQTCKTKVNRNKAGKVTKLKPVKCKKDKTLNKHHTQKKYKETNDTNAKQNRVRKEKYTKTVKKWLDGVDPNYTADIEYKHSNNQATSEIETKICDKIVAKEQNAPSKKVIQAQLINKGGIMKFSKPAQDTTDYLSKDNAIETTDNIANKFNRKKGKPKFVAPLKSQVPLKEIDFSVAAVDETNWKEHLQDVNNNAELYAVLMYSNGFCQLNEQFTEDECIPEGIMLLIHEQFYYFKKTNDTFSNIIIHFLEKQTVVCYDGKNILIFLKHNFDLEINRLVIRDLKIGGGLLEPDQPPESFGALQKQVSSAPQGGVAAACPLQKTAWYLTLLRDCAGKLTTQLIEQSLWSLFEDIEMKVLPIIADMEFLGIQVNTEKLREMEGALESRMRAVEAACVRAAGRPLLLTSPARVAALLYGELRLPAPRRRSVAEPELRRLAPLHPLPGLILEYRRIHKAHATFLVGIAQHVKDGVLRPTWVQTAAATGRIAACNPNVQAIPKAPFRLSSDDSDPGEALQLRSVYSARAGRLLLAADFCQLECRVLAAAAGDARLQRALAAGDLFTALAASWLNKPQQSVTAAEREHTKRVVYARMYGGGLRAQGLRPGSGRARAVAGSFDSTFPSLREYCARVVRACAGTCTARTAAGRLRRLPALRAGGAAAARAQRQAVNFHVQGAAADVCKRAMVAAAAALRAAGLRPRLLLQLHDELLWELPPHRLREAHDVIRAAMEGSGAAAGLGRLPVRLRAGHTWGELRDLPEGLDAWDSAHQ